MREMRAADGAFYSSLDADSEGEEGKFYVWSATRSRRCSTPTSTRSRAPHFGLDGPPNFEGHAWHLRVAQPLARSPRSARHRAGRGARRGSTRAQREAARRARAPRASGPRRQGADGWNALAIAGLARAAARWRAPAWSDARARPRSTRCAAPSWRDGRLLRDASQGGARALNAYLDDYAFLLDALRRADADATSGATTTTGRASSPTRCSSSSRTASAAASGSQPRPRAADPPHEAGPRQRDAVGQRRGGARARVARRARRRAALRRRGASAPSRASRRRSRTRPAASRRCSRPRDALEHPPTSVIARRRAPHAAAMARRARARATGPASRSTSSIRARAPPELVKGAAPASGARAWVCRGMTCLPPVDAADAGRCERARCAGPRRAAAAIESGLSTSAPEYPP